MADAGRSTAVIDAQNIFDTELPYAHTHECKFDPIVACALARTVKSVSSWRVAGEPELCL
jgi:hypothetical protein